MTDSERTRLESLLSKDLDDIYMLIAQSDPAYRNVMFSPAEARKKGQASLERLGPALRQKLCVEWDYCARRRDPDLADSVTLVGMVADLIVSLAGGIPAVLLAVAIVKKGLATFCGC